MSQPIEIRDDRRLSSYATHAVLPPFGRYHCLILTFGVIEPRGRDLEGTFVDDTRSRSILTWRRDGIPTVHLDRIPAMRRRHPEAPHERSGLSRNLQDFYLERFIDFRRACRLIETLICGHDLVFVSCRHGHHRSVAAAEVAAQWARRDVPGRDFELYHCDVFHQTAIDDDFLDIMDEIYDRIGI